MEPVAPSEKALAIVRDLQSARQQPFSTSMPFSTLLAESQATKVSELLGFKDNYRSSEGSDSNRNGYVDVVTLSQQGADNASRKKSLRPREIMNWSLGTDMHLISVGEHLHVFLYTPYRRGVESR